MAIKIISTINKERRIKKVSKTFVIGDTEFYNNRYARKNGFLNVEKYNNKIIDNINEAVSNDDIIVFFGELCNDTDIDDTLCLLRDRINGKIYLRVRNELETDDFNTNGKFIAELKLDICQRDNKDNYIIVTNEPDYYGENERMFFCCANSAYEQDEVYQSHHLNISCNKWYFKPIELGDNLIQIIDDYELFNSMENFEEVLN